MAYYAVFSQTFHMNRKRFSAKVNKVSDLTYDTDFFEDWQEASWLKFIYESLCNMQERFSFYMGKHQRKERKEGWRAPIFSLLFYGV